MTSVLVLGGAGVDTIVYVPQLPLPYRDSYPVPEIRTRAGQTGDNVAVGLRTLGLTVTHLDALGDDPEGDLVRALHQRYGVALIAVPAGAGTKRAVNLVDPQGRRLSLFDASRGRDDDVFPAQLLAELVAAADHVHVSITQPCRQALEQLVGGTVTVSTDLHNWDGHDRYQRLFADLADIVFLSATALADHEATMRAILERGRASLVIATAGADGGYVLERGAAKVTEYSAVAPGGPVVDSNGAGDAFVSGFLLGHLRGQPIETCLRYGAAAGAHACTVPSTGVDPIGLGALRAAAGDR